MIQAEGWTQEASSICRQDIRKRIVAAVEGGTSRLVRELIAQAPDQTLYELRDRLAGVVASWSVARRCPDIYRPWVGRAKKRTLHAAEQDRPDLAAARSA